MESITIKVEERLAKEIGRAMKSGYSTKTEFIREAIREKINSVDKDIAWKKLMNFRSNTKTSDRKLHKIRDEVFREYAKKFGVKLD